MPSPPTIRNPLRHPLTNAEKIAAAAHKHAQATAAAVPKKAPKRAKPLPPPDEMAENLLAKERLERQKTAAAARKVAIRNGKWDFTKGKPMTNAQKIAAAAKKAKKGGGVEKRVKSAKEVVSEELGFKKVHGKGQVLGTGRVLGTGKVIGKGKGRTKKVESIFATVMGQTGDQNGAFVGIGRRLSEVDVEGEEDDLMESDKDDFGREG